MSAGFYVREMKFLKTCQEAMSDNHRVILGRYTNWFVSVE